MQVVIDEFCGSVEQLIEELSKLPKHYRVSLTGMSTFAIGQDDKNETILLDEQNYDFDEEFK